MHISAAHLLKHSSGIVVWINMALFYFTHCPTSCFYIDENKPIWMHAEEREECKVRTYVECKFLFLFIGVKNKIQHHVLDFRESKKMAHLLESMEAGIKLAKLIGMYS